MFAVSREKEGEAIRAFSARYGLTCTGSDTELRARGAIDGVAVSVAKVRRGLGSSPCWATQFAAFADEPFAGGLVVFKPNFLIRLPGPRRISDDIGIGGLFSFVHRDAVGDREIDRKLIVQADDVGTARQTLTREQTKRAILTALEAAGHIRIKENEVALERADRVKGLMSLIESPEEVERLAMAAVSVVHELSGRGAS